MAALCVSAKEVIPLLLNKPRADGVSLVAVVVLCAGSLAQAQTTLRYQFKEGEKLSYLVEIKTLDKTTVAGSPMTSETTERLDLGWHVATMSTEGNARVTQTLERFRFQAESSAFTYRFDSQEGRIPGGPLGEKLGVLHKALVGAELSMTISPRGEIDAVKLSDKLLGSIKRAHAAIAPGQILSDDRLRDLLRVGLLPVLPMEPVIKGRSGEIRLKSPLVGKAMAVTYTSPLNMLIC